MPRTITSEDLRAVTGGVSAAERAKAQVGSEDRCSYVKEHLGQLGATESFMNRVPRITRNPRSFGNAELKDRLQMEHFFNCRPTPEPAE